MGKTTRTFCRICEAACGLTVQRDDAGHVIRLRPDADHPASRGYACAKGTRFAEVANHPDRLLHPVVDGAQTPWPEAIGAVAGRLRRLIDEHGPHAVAMYFGNPMAFNALGYAASFGFVKALGTRNLFYAGSQDCNNKFAGAQIVHGSPVVHPIADFDHAELAVVLGSNPYVSQSSFMHLEGGAHSVFGGIIERGGNVVWIDPRRTESARRWGEHIAIRPGTDALLLLALLKILGTTARSEPSVDGLDRMLALADSVDLKEVGTHTGLGLPAIERLADQIRRSRATAFHMSVGVNQSGSGTLAYVAMHALAYVTGNLDRRGGLLFSPLGSVLDRVYRLARIGNDNRSRVGDFPSTMGTLPGGVLADEILTPGRDQIRAVLVIAGDPLRSIPGAARLRTAFSQLEFLGCIDMFENLTGRHAHALLPSASWLERWDLNMASLPFKQNQLVQIAGPVMPPPGDAKTDARILSELALAMGLPGRFWWRIGARDVDGRLPDPKFGLRGPRLRPGRYLARHKINLWHDGFESDLHRLRELSAKRAGFTLICRRRRLGHNSWLHGGVRSGEPEESAWMRADDMRALGLENGALAEVSNEEGNLRIPVTAYEGLAPRTIVVPHGLPRINVNELIPAGANNIEPVSGQLRMTGIQAHVSRVAGAS